MARKPIKTFLPGSAWTVKVSLAVRDTVRPAPGVRPGITTGITADVAHWTPCEEETSDDTTTFEAYSN